MLFLTVAVALGMFFAADGATINLTIRFSNSSLDPNWFLKDTRVFGLNWYSCIGVIGTNSCPGGEASFNDD